MGGGCSCVLGNGMEVLLAMRMDGVYFAQGPVNESSYEEQYTMSAADIFSGSNGMTTNGSANGSGHTHGNDYPVPAPRREWIVKRKEEAARSGDWNMSQMHFARKGMVTEEMAFVAHKEKISAELVRSEIAKGTMIIPANINHPELEPMAIGVESLCKINANIGNSALVSNVDEELRKLHTAVHFGADTVMDLSTGGDIPMIREQILRHSPVPIGTVPLYEALTRVKKVEDLNIDLYLEVIEEQAQQGVDYFTIHAGRADPVRAYGCKAHHRHCEPRRRHPGAVDDRASQAELPV